MKRFHYELKQQEKKGDSNCERRTATPENSHGASRAADAKGEG